MFYVVIMFSLVEFIPKNTFNIESAIDNAIWCNNIFLKKLTLYKLNTKLQKNNDQITITPISKDIKRLSNIDYQEQLKSKNWCWDEAPSEHTSINLSPKKGQLFAFYFPKIKIIIHRVTDILEPTNRLPSWSHNVGQSDRKVLMLTKPLKTFTYEEWCTIKGPRKQQGTYTSDLNSKKWSHLKCHLENL